MKLFGLFETSKLLLVIGIFTLVKVDALSQVQTPVAPSGTVFPNYAQNNFINPSNNRGQIPVIPSSFNPNLNRQQQQNRNTMQEVEQHQKRQAQAMNEMRADIEQLQAVVRYTLPSYSKFKGTEFYYEAFEKIILLDTTFSLKENNFLVENAYFGNTLDKAGFDKIINQSGQFIKNKMKEQGYDLNSNAAKNFMLFQFFSETLQLKSNSQTHLPFKYDFDDYMGVKNYAKMFVTKLLDTGSGQCHSMPLLYLILADEINAEAYLALSPNHSYIRFPDDSGKWFNVELTNGMLSTDSHILQSGYIKSEALQNNVYMVNLSKKDLLANLLTDLASGYVHKFGYDEFVKQVIDKALEFSPNALNTHMVKANLDTARFQHVMKQLDIDPTDKKQLQKIGRYPKAVELLNGVNQEYNFIDNLGFEKMPDEAYQDWLQSMKDEKQKEDNKKLSDQLKKITLKNKTLKN